MIIRATRDLAAGTEIFFWYANPWTASNEEFQKKLKHWGFVCDCAICSDARALDSAVLRKRQVLTKKIKQTFEASSFQNDQRQKIRRLIDELEQTYSKLAAEIPRFLLWDAQLALGQMYASQGESKLCVKTMGEALKSLGFISSRMDSAEVPFEISRWGLLVDDLVDIFLLLRTCFKELMLELNSQRAEAYARNAYKMIIGEDTSFDRMYKQ